MFIIIDGMDNEGTIIIRALVENRSLLPTQLSRVMRYAVKARIEIFRE